jgi:hypothetical protein
MTVVFNDEGDAGDNRDTGQGTQFIVKWNVGWRCWRWIQVILVIILGVKRYSKL